MRVVYVNEKPDNTLSRSIFLAGPSPRNSEHANWRNRALELLEEAGFDGTVFMPLTADGKFLHSYITQVEWETTYLNMADLIIFWCPRDMTVSEDVPEGSSAEQAMRLPAFTTNVEFGTWVNSGKAILGYPVEARKMRYLAYHANEQSVPVFHSLEDTLSAGVQRLKVGAERTEGEREVPLHIWRLPHFQGWYKSQIKAGNRLDSARLLWSFRVGPTKSFTFAYALHVNIYIGAEQRNKVNEFIYARPDIATIVAYRHGENLIDTEIALIREFRSPTRTTDGFVREVPGGSSWKPDDDPLVTMTHELEEETGLGEGAGFTINPSRLTKIGVRQLCSTLSVHVAHVFACELTEAEMTFLKGQHIGNIVHGVEADTERTYVEVHHLGNLLKAESDSVDWSMIGMILTALNQ
ncbi:MAG TPA: nucleoside 2-deoxyribosyltransferase domain-containing protein [Candidatus Paceibacterota bacterium]